MRLFSELAYYNNNNNNNNDDNNNNNNKKKRIPYGSQCSLHVN